MRLQATVLMMQSDQADGAKITSARIRSLAYACAHDAVSTQTIVNYVLAHRHNNADNDTVDNECAEADNDDTDAEDAHTR